MQQLFLKQEDRTVILQNINVFKRSDSSIVDQICINNVADVIYKTLNQNQKFLFQRFSQKFVYCNDYRKAVSFNIANDFFNFLDQKNVSLQQAIDSLNYNIGEFVQAYALFLFGL